MEMPVIASAPPPAAGGGSDGGMDEHGGHHHHRSHDSNYHQTSNSTGGGGPNAAAAKKKTTGPIHNPRYKSIMCDHWERNGGTCPYAEKCQFAHGAAELAKWQAHRARQQTQQQQVPQQHAAPGGGVHQQFTSPVKGHQAQMAQPQVQYMQFVQPSHAQPQANGRITPMKEPSPASYSMHHEYLPSAYYGFATSAPHAQIFQSPTGGGTFTTAYAPHAQLYAPQANLGSAGKPGIGLVAPQPSLSAPPSGSGPQHLARATSPFADFSTSQQSASYGIGSRQPDPLFARASHLSQQQPQPQQQQQQHHHQSRQTPVGSVSSTPPPASPFPLGSSFAPVGASGGHNSASSRRSISPDTQQSLDVLSYPELLGDMPVPRSGPDSRRTASLPQLFSKDFLNSLNGSEPENNEAGYGLFGGASTNHGSSAATPLGLSGRLSQTDDSRGSLNAYGAGVGASTHSPPIYSSSRRGSAPPVVLSVVTNSIGDYNSLADLDSLADDIISEPATASQQLFHMSTVFSSSIGTTANQASSSSTGSHSGSNASHSNQGASINEFL